MEERTITVRPAYEHEWQDAMGVVWLTFLKCDADDYEPEGVKNFKAFISDENLYRMFKNGHYQMFVALDGERIVGVITLRNISHISLLFVDVRYHRQGIGTKLIDYVHNYLLTELAVEYVTVNASPYGVDFYSKMGFRAIAPQTAKDGITYTLMKLYL